MNTNLNHGFAGFAKTILITLMVCVTFFISTNPSVLALEGVSAGTAKNTSESEILLDPVPGGPGFIMVSPYGFRPFNHLCQWNVAAGVYNPSSEYETYLAAALTLPHGATITKVTLYFRDNDPDDDIYLRLYRGDATGISETLVEFTPEINEIGFQVISVSDIAEEYEKVDNQSYSYYLFTMLPAKEGVIAEVEITNVRIDYEYTNNLPAVMR